MMVVSSAVRRWVLLDQDSRTLSHLHPSTESLKQPLRRTHKWNNNNNNNGIHVPTRTNCAVTEPRVGEPT
jgi:hypothetical protein